MQEIKPEQCIKGLPPNAQAAYLTARTQCQATGDVLPMRAWRSMWGRYLHDPQRALVELDYTKMLLDAKGKYRNEGEEAAGQRSNLLEAKTLLQAARVRGTGTPELLTLILTQEAEIDKRIASIDTRSSGRR